MYSPLSDIDQNASWTLTELSLAKASTLAVSIVYLCILLVVGLVGNIFVLIIFYFRFSNSTHRCFILTLAFYDLFACSVGAPFTIVEPFFAFTYYDEVSCKIFRFVLYYTCIASSTTLTLIAVERCRKICTPLNTQFTVPMAKKAIILLGGIFSSLSAAPALIIYGNATIPTGYRNITGTKCFIKDEFVSTDWPIGFNVYLLFLAFLYTFIMSVCYFRIAQTVSQMGQVNIAKRMKTMDKANVDMQESSSVFNDDLASNDELDSDIVSVKSNSRISRSDLTPLPKVNSSKSLHSLTSNSKGQRSKLRGKSSHWANKVLRRLSSESGKKTLRVTKMFIFVTVAFVVSYLPHLSLMIWSLMTSELDNLPTDNVYQFMFYSFLVNNLLNPFIYAAMDLKFRNELKKLLKCRMQMKRR